MRSTVGSSTSVGNRHVKSSFLRDSIKYNPSSCRTLLLRGARPLQCYPTGKMSSPPNHHPALIAACPTDGFCIEVASAATLHRILKSFPRPRPSAVGILNLLLSISAKGDFTSTSAWKLELKLLTTASSRRTE